MCSSIWAGDGQRERRGTPWRRMLAGRLKRVYRGDPAAVRFKVGYMPCLQGETVLRDKFGGAGSATSSQRLLPVLLRAQIGEQCPLAGFKPANALLAGCSHALRHCCHLVLTSATERK